MKAKSILVVEDEHALGTALSMLVRRMGHLPVLVASGAAARDATKKDRFDAVVLDIGLPDMSGLRLLEAWRESGEETPVLVITAHATLDHAIQAQKSGATGYLTKPLDLREFERTLAGLLTQGVPLAAMPGSAAAGEVSVTLIGAAPCLREVFVGIARACASEVPVLIAGPSGSGKTLAASVIHAHSTRGGQAMERIEAGQVRDLAEIGERHCGTLVIEEVTTLAAGMQADLAMWLSGGAAGPRILATTVREPREAVESGCLREDLYYALSPLTITLPPLRERSGDIAALSAFFTGLRSGSGSPRISPPAMAALEAYAWPGNVRELRHVLDYALGMSGGGPVFPNHLPAHVAAAAGVTAELAASAPGELEIALGRWLDSALATEAGKITYDILLDRIEAVALRHLLERHDGKPTHLATALGMHRATLRQKLRRLGLQGE